MKVINTLILSVLVVIAVLLVALYFRPNHPASRVQVAAAATPSTQPVQTPASISPPVAPPAAPKRHHKSPAHSAKPSATSGNSTSDYTQANPQMASAGTSTFGQPPAPSGSDTSLMSPMAVPPPPSPAPPAPIIPAVVHVTIPPGTSWTIRLAQKLDSSQLKVGDTFRATIDDPISYQGQIVVPRGTAVEGSIETIQEPGKMTGLAQLTLELNKLHLATGDPIALQTDSLTRQGSSNAVPSAEKIGAGTAIGAIIGALAGHGKGAAIGAGVGAGAGGGAVLLGHGKPVILNSETRLSFVSQAPVSFDFTPPAEDASSISPSESPATVSSDPGRPQLLRRPAAANGGG